ncbi:protein SSUH2 homolog [Panonychus citri]|uniref:protein SSUH2 homolog n=1 Tax=Panonychus citri TaxID=50023 RepID=UPI0023074D18|nr:protein SSUH2 homolog [Panonychus citri]
MDPLSRILGYGEAENFDKRVEVPPPPFAPTTVANEDNQESTKCNQIVRLPLSGIIEMSEDDVRQALLHHVERFLCYGKKAVKEMVITKMDYYSSYRYTLETLTETRSVGWAFDSYAGIDLDSRKCGPPPDPWEIHVRTPDSFETRITTSQVPVPHTEYIQMCHFCNETGRITCNLCRGRCKVDCSWCNGFSTTGDHTCVHCTGGKVKCGQCKATGVQRCDPCLGTGKIVCYVALFVTWAKNFDSCLIEHSDIPKDMVKKASGTLILNETDENMQTIEYFQDSNINRDGIELMDKHIARYINKGKPVFHRQKVARIPIVRVYYSWKTFLGHFWVYGTERFVFAPNYPQKSCCGCTIN